MEKLITGCLSLLLVGLSSLLLISLRPLAGFRAQGIVSGSMEPAIQTGSIVITRQLQEDAYRVGDIITFQPPARTLFTVTHRIIELKSTADGLRAVQTKGDANTNGDPWKLTTGAIQGKYLFALPWLGYLLYFCKTQLGFLIFVTLGSLFAAVRLFRWFHY